MKQNFLRIHFYLLLAVASVFAACSKEGPAGPAGPAGAQGPAGSAGATGLPGAAGATGTANVIYSAWLDATATIIDPVDSIWADTLNVPKLDNNILTTGIVKVYFNFGTTATPDIAALPDLVFLPSIYTFFNVGKIELLSFFNFSSFTSTTDNQRHWQIRYILIPGGVPARWAVNWNNYSEVQKFLNLKD